MREKKSVREESKINHLAAAADKKLTGFCAGWKHVEMLRRACSCNTCIDLQL